MVELILFYLLYSPFYLPLYCIHDIGVTLNQLAKKMKVEFRKLRNAVQVMYLKATFRKKLKIQFFDSRVTGLIPMRM